MNKITKILTLAAASSCLLFAGASMNASPDSNKGVENGSKKVLKKAPASLLFVFQAQNATLTHIQGKQYKFSFPVSKDSKVLAFSDRPNRIAFEMPRDKWVKMVMSGANSFKTDPPNIVLTWPGGENAIMAFKVTGGEHTHQVQQYSLQRLGGSVTDKGAPNLANKDVTVVVDSASEENTGVCINNCGAEYNLNGGKQLDLCLEACTEQINGGSVE